MGSLNFSYVMSQKMKLVCPYERFAPLLIAGVTNVAVHTLFLPLRLPLPLGGWPNTHIQYGNPI